MTIAGKTNGGEMEKNQLLGLLHLQSTPRKAEVVTLGYDLSTWSGRRDNCATLLLAVLLLVIAITVSGLTSSMRLIYIQADLCKTGEATLDANLKLMRNITNYYRAMETKSKAVNITATSYFQAEEAYNALDLTYSWPSPYDLSEEERQELELQAREGGDDCESVEECVGGVVGFIGGVVGADTCAEVDVPCPDIGATELLVQYDAAQNSLDLFGNNVTTSDEDVENSLAQEALDKATEAITVLVRRINFASSIYVLYLSFLVIVTPPFIVYGAKWNLRIFDFLGNVNKPMWILLIVLVWYGHELFQSIINSSLYKVIWSNFLQDPCWADPDYLVNTSISIRDTCIDIAAGYNLFNQAAANYRYYHQVEATWLVVAPDAGGPFYGDPDVDFPQNYTGNCSPSVLLDAIQPGDGNVNWWSLFFNSGALVALTLQLVLAHWFISWFSVLRPLTMNRGRVMIPESSQGDYSLFREVRGFARKRAILPFVFSTAFLLFLMVNLGASSSDEKMGRKVLIGALILAFFQFCIIPALIWRSADETTDPVSTFQGKSSRSSRRRVVGGLEEGDGRTVTVVGGLEEGERRTVTTRVTTTTVNGQQRQRTEWEHDEEWVEEEGSSGLSGSPSPRSSYNQMRWGYGNGAPQQQDDREEREEHRIVHSSSSSESLSSILKAAMEATEAASAVGQGKYVPRY